MSNQNYNGWTNKQTWHINLMYQDIFGTMSGEQEYDDIEYMADSFKNLVDELEFNGLREHSLAYQAVGEFLDQVNWEEIAAHYYGDTEEILGDEDDDRYEAMAQRLAE